MAYEEELLKITFTIGSDLSEATKIIPLVRLGHKESYFGDLPFEDEPFYEMCRFAKDKPSEYGCLYVEYDGKPAACAFYMLRPLLGSHVHRVTVVHGIYIRTDLRATKIGGYIWERMLMMIRGWGAPRSSRGIMLNVVTGIALSESDAVIRASGGTYLGGNYFIRG